MLETTYQTTHHIPKTQRSLDNNHNQSRKLNYTEITQQSQTIFILFFFRM
jgi:hypothetical protein